jgi:hypothetical protein
MKLKGFCTREMVSKLKRPPTEWEKIFASYTSGKGLTTGIYRELKKLNSPQINESIKKWASELNRSFSMEEVLVVMKPFCHRKGCGYMFLYISCCFYSESVFSRDFASPPLSYSGHSG